MKTDTACHASLQLNVLSRQAIPLTFDVLSNSWLTRPDCVGDGTNELELLSHGLTSQRIAFGDTEGQNGA